jgi:predicted NAD/FAD-dependent oxidoreductase
VETDIEKVKQQMLQSFVQLTGIGNTPEHIAIHRWKYSILDSLAIKGPLIDYKLKIAASSDWAITSRIEDVWLLAE